MITHVHSRSLIFIFTPQPPSLLEVPALEFAAQFCGTMFFMTIKAVFFDVGETLVNEERQWGLWADWLGVTRFAFFAALGSVIERNEPHRHVFEIIRPGFDPKAAKFERQRQGIPDELQLEDFYSDAIPCLQELKSKGYFVGLSGNQPTRAEELLTSYGLPVDYIASSSSWGIEKPDLRFFQKILEITALEPHEVAYVGDRLDNDILPALEVGMKAIFVRRGPWGFIHASREEVSRASLQLDSLENLGSLLEKF
jgi:HAD superfamily hydrolase (TIGR01549 family)